jgi:uncharacterized membrane protein
LLSPLGGYRGSPTEVGGWEVQVMLGRGSGILGVLVAVWLVIGVIAAAQRGYFGDDREVNCKTTSDTVLTVISGPLNYMGVNPKVKCRVPEPSR